VTSCDVLASYVPTVRFLDRPVPPETLDKIFSGLQNVPTQFHLQPANYCVVEDAQLKTKLKRAVVDKTALLDAPCFVIFTASRFVRKIHQEKIIDQELENGSMTLDQTEDLEKQIQMYFDVSPIGLGWIGKLVGAPLLRLFTAIPQLACIHKREWLVKQVMRNSSLFWHLARDLGLACEFIDTFDEWRIKLYMNIPWHHVVVSIVALGYAAESGQKRSHLDIEDVLYCNG